MAANKSLHSICRWTFNPGKGGFVPADMRPAWKTENLDAVGVIRLIKEKIAPRLPANVELGFELHYDTEVDERTAPAIADALAEAGIYLALITPGAHSHFAYGGIASLDPSERKAAEELGLKAVDLAYGPLRKAWHPDPAKAPTFVLWNGSYGYDLATPAVRRMYANLKESVADLCKYEEKKGGALYIGIEPKPNEGHPAMLLPTVASALLFFRKLEEEFGRTIFIKGQEEVPPGEVRVLGRGPRSELAEMALPVEEGEVRDLEILERHAGNPEDGIARIEGYVIDVEGAGEYVGSTLQVEVTKVFRTYAKGRIVQVVE